MNTQYGHQGISRKTHFAVQVMKFDQGNQTLPEHDTIHLDQVQFLAGPLALTGALGSAKVICFIIEWLGDWRPVILPNQEAFFRIPLSPDAYQHPYHAQAKALTDDIINATSI